MRRGSGTAVLVALAAGLVGGCGTAPDPWLGEAGSPRVVVTIAPLASFVKGVAGDRAAVRCLCTVTGPHHYSDEGADSRLLQRADLFLAVGLTLDEQFAQPLQEKCHNPRLRYVTLGDRLPPELLRKLPTPIRHGDHTHDGYDPHVWLGVEPAVALVGLIRDELIRVDGAGADEYRKNADAYIARLKQLQARGLELLKDRSSRRLISQHDSLHYFARSFGLEVAGVIQASAGDDPTAKGQANLVDLCARDAKAGKPVGAIAVEPQYSKDTAATALQKELQGRGIRLDLVPVDPLETAEAKDLARQGADWYLERMTKNLEALAGALP